MPRQKKILKLFFGEKTLAAANAAAKKISLYNFFS
jgi:hypothetical protein